MTCANRNECRHPECGCAATHYALSTGAAAPLRPRAPDQRFVAVPLAAPHRANTSPWPFHETAAARRAEFATIQANTTTWKEQAETLWCDAVNSRSAVDLQALRAHIDRVVAVRA